MTAREKFKGIAADYWDCRSEPERLTHRDPVSALAAFIESHRRTGHDTEPIVRELGTITVSAFGPVKFTEGQIQDVARSAIEFVTEELDELDDCGDPVGIQIMFTREVVERRLPLFEYAVSALAADAKCWRCEVIERVELSADEALEILRAERPGWFPLAPLTRWRWCLAEPNPDDDEPVYSGMLTDDAGGWVRWEDVARLLPTLTEES